MTQKEENFCFEIAWFLCWPSDGIEIGGVSSQLLDIIKIMTKGRKSIKKFVLELCQDFIIEDKYNKSIYGVDKSEAIIQMEEEYDKLFY
jgi:hypothetical protein